MVEITTLELPAIPTFFHDSNVLPEHLFNNWGKKNKKQKTQGCLAESNHVAEIATVAFCLLSFAGHA